LPTAPQTPSPLRLAAIYGVYCASGAAALMYEVSWTRQLGEVLGHTAQTAGVVLAAYFFGLALGYEVGGRLARRIDPLKGYAVAECIAAVWAVVIALVLLPLADRPAVVQWLGNNREAGALALQVGLCLALLLPATAPLGATLPLMAQWLERRDEGHPLRRTIWAYALNTWGAMLGVVVATGVLLVQVGVRSTSFVAAGVSLLCARLAWRLSTGSAARIENAALPPPAKHSRAPAVVAAASGFGLLGLEVLYVRLHSLVLHNSSYSFGLVVAVYLLALALGAALSGWLMRWVAPQRIVVGSLLLGSVTVVGSVYVFARLTRFQYFEAGDSLSQYLASCAGLMGGVVLPPVVVMGMTLPAVWRGAIQESHESGRSIGRLTLVNTLAAAAGSLAASYLLLPTLGLWWSFAFFAGLSGLVAAAILWSRDRRGAGAAGVIATAAGVGLLAVSPPSPRSAARNEHEQTLRRWETAYGWVDVVQNDKTGALDIRQNLHYRYGSTGDDAVREMRQAHLPLLLHPRPHDVLFLGLGTGVTAAGALAHPDVEHVTVVELIPEVVTAARMLGEGNRHIVDHPQVRVAVDDARHFLLAEEQPFDVIVGDLFVPWESGAGYLYTREHFQRLRARLKLDGVACQWLALYQLGPEEVALIADTFASVFPDTTLWWGHLNSTRPMVALIGTNTGVDWAPAAWTQRSEQLLLPPRLHDDQLATGERIAELLIGRWPAQPDVRLNTVEHPRVEFEAPRSHKDRRLLSRSALRRYFDEVLSRLPAPDNVDPVELERTRANQRYVLFGETQP
jgi:spermidine synthase